MIKGSKVHVVNVLGESRAAKELERDEGVLEDRYAGEVKAR